MSSSVSGFLSFIGMIAIAFFVVAVFNYAMDRIFDRFPQFEEWVLKILGF